MKFQASNADHVTVEVHIKGLMNKHSQDVISHQKRQIDLIQTTNDAGGFSNIRAATSDGTKGK